jgi:hypothetical protein
MYLMHETFDELCAFLYGFQVGTEGDELKGFQAWIADHYNDKPELAFPSLVLHVAFPDRDRYNSAEFSRDENRHATETLFDLLITFLQC